jgi:hypothetical protein
MERWRDGEMERWRDGERERERDERKRKRKRDPNGEIEKESTMDRDTKQ